MKFPQFDRYACIGDSITWQKDGFDITATLEADTESHVSDSDCYSPKQIAAWKNDDWFFVGVVLSVSRNGIEILEHAASLWGIDCNFPSRRKIPNWYLSDVAQELESDALAEAEKKISRILEALQK